MLRLAVFVSGRGSNLNAILDSIKNGNINATVIAIITDNKGCNATDTAKANGIECYYLSRSSVSGFIHYEQLCSLLQQLNIDLIVLAGFLKKIPDDVVDCFENRIINIHPALLPSFGGPGMYGMNVHKAVFDSSAKVSGATVHFVNKVYDNGRIIAQAAVDISHVQSPEEIAEKVLNIEHKILPFVIKKIAENKVFLKENRVIIVD